MCPDKCKIELFETNYGIVLECELEDTARSKGQTAELIFDDIPIRSASAKGFKTANRPISKFLKKKRGTEKPPEEEVIEEVETEEEEEAKTRKAMGWKSKTPIRFTAPNPSDKEEEVVEEEPAKDSKKMFLKTSVNETATREIPEPEPVKEETEEVEEEKAEALSEREIPTPEPIAEEKPLEVEVTITKNEPAPESKEIEEETDTKEEQASEETQEEEATEEKQAELDLPQESGARRYLIDEDNPFMLEP